MLFYKLDIKHADDHVHCIKNMLVSFALKNPLYSHIVILIQKCYRAELA